jgi:hypothetical protein
MFMPCMAAAGACTVAAGIGIPPMPVPCMLDMGIGIPPMLMPAMFMLQQEPPA